MTRIVKPELAADLTDLLPVLEPRSLSPTSVSDELILVQALLPGTHKFRNAVSERDVAAGGGIVILTSAVPSDRYRYCFGVSAHHNDAVVHNLRLEVVYSIGGGAGYTIAFTAGLAANQRVVSPRAILLPPTALIQAVSEAMGAGAVLTIDVTFVEHRILDPAPGV